MPDKTQILVIKHGALGDIVLSTGPMKAIREHHADAHIILLTTQAYQPLLERSGWFDEIWVDERAKAYQWLKVAALKRRLRSVPFAWVYDLQTSSRSSWYHAWMRAPKPNWSGVAKGASHSCATPERASLHTIERQAQQLAIAGIDTVQLPDISWLHGEAAYDGLARDYVLLVPGGSAHRPLKRYPVRHYITLAQRLCERGVQPVLIGGGAEAALLDDIASAVDGALNLCNKTALGDIAELARGACGAVGNDTGPMHIIAATGCVSVVLFSRASNPDLCAPRQAEILRKDDLNDLAPDDVLYALDRRMQSSHTHCGTMNQ